MLLLLYDIGRQGACTHQLFAVPLPWNSAPLHFVQTEAKVKSVIAPSSGRPQRFLSSLFRSFPLQLLLLYRLLRFVSTPAPHLEVPSGSTH